MKKIKLAILGVTTILSAQVWSQADGGKKSSMVDMEISENANKVKTKFSIAGGFTVRHLSVNVTPITAAFTNNGFSAPKNSGIMWGGQGYIVSQSGWRLGGAGSSYNNNTEAGQYLGNINLSYAGLLVGKQFDLGPSAVFGLNALVGGGAMTLDILSATQDGRYTQNFFMMEPQMEFIFKTTSFFSVGLMVAYLYPVASGATYKGDDFGVSDITKGAVSAGLSFIFGPVDMSLQNR